MWERNSNRLLPVLALTGINSQPGAMCPDRGLNPSSFGVRAPARAHSLKALISPVGSEIRSTESVAWCASGMIGISWLKVWSSTQTPLFFQPACLLHWRSVFSSINRGYFSFYDLIVKQIPVLYEHQLCSHSNVWSPDTSPLFRIEELKVQKWECQTNIGVNVWERKKKNPSSGAS